MSGPNGDAHYPPLYSKGDDLGFCGEADDEAAGGHGNGCSGQQCFEREVRLPCVSWLGADHTWPN